MLQGGERFFFEMDRIRIFKGKPPPLLGGGEGREVPAAPIFRGKGGGGV